MSVTARVSDVAIASTRQQLRGRIEQITKVRRYWSGKAPEWAEEVEEDEHNVYVLDRDFTKHDDLVLVRKDDPRLRRLAQTRIDNLEQVRANHLRVRQEAEIISTEEEDEEEFMRNQEDEDEDALEETRRRSRIREQNLKRAQEEAVQDEEEEESESEYETDSEEEMSCITMIKPVFVPKAGRDTVTEREQLEAEERVLEELAKRKLEMRKIETKQIVVKEVRDDEELQKKMLMEEANIEDVETDDEINEAEEYEVWKIREIAKIKREKREREAMLRETEETEQESKNLKPSSSAKPKKKWKFMQRYYHKGAFFQEAGGIFQRDFSAPTGEDRLDKSKLRKVMQVKHFGRSGRTKWTHLVNEDTTYETIKEDTTCWSNPWTCKDHLRVKYNKKMAAIDAPIAKPKGSKKMKDWET